jgi:hypothetical protein
MFILAYQLKLGYRLGQNWVVASRDRMEGMALAKVTKVGFCKSTNPGADVL